MLQLSLFESVPPIEIRSPQSVITTVIDAEKTHSFVSSDDAVSESAEPGLFKTNVVAEPAAAELTLPDEPSVVEAGQPQTRTEALRDRIAEAERMLELGRQAAALETDLADTRAQLRTVERLLVGLEQDLQANPFNKRAMTSADFKAQERRELEARIRELNQQLDPLREQTTVTPALGQIEDWRQELAELERPAPAAEAASAEIPDGDTARRPWTGADLSEALLKSLAQSPGRFNAGELHRAVQGAPWLIDVSVADLHTALKTLIGTGLVERFIASANGQGIVLFRLKATEAEYVDQIDTSSEHVDFSEKNVHIPLQPAALIACCGKKSRTPAPARALYLSDLFRKSVAYAEQRGCRWWVLSALHELVDADQVLSPYNHSLEDVPLAGRRAWSERVAAAIQKAIPAGTPLLILAGGKYTAQLLHLLEMAGYPIELPLKGMPIGKQKQWLKAQIVPQVVPSILPIGGAVHLVPTDDVRALCGWVPGVAGWVPAEGAVSCRACERRAVELGITPAGPADAEGLAAARAELVRVLRARREHLLETTRLQLTPAGQAAAESLGQKTAPAETEKPVAEPVSPEQDLTAESAPDARGEGIPALPGEGIPGSACAICGALMLEHDRGRRIWRCSADSHHRFWIKVTGRKKADRHGIWLGRSASEPGSGEGPIPAWAS